MKKVIVILLWTLIMITSIAEIHQIQAADVKAIFYDDFSSGDYSDKWIAGEYAWYGYTKEWIPADGDWVEKEGYLYGRGDGDYYTFTRSRKYQPEVS